MTKREQIVWPTGVPLDADLGMFGKLLAVAADLVIAIDRRGTIVSVTTNAENWTLGCLDHWVGRSLSDFITSECHVKFEALLAAFSDPVPDRTRGIQLNHVDNATWGFPIDYTAYDTGGAIILIGRDLKPVAEI